MYTLILLDEVMMYASLARRGRRRLAGAPPELLPVPDAGRGKAVDPVAVGDKALEIVLPEKARLAGLNPGLLAPGVLPDLWKSAADDGG